MIINGKVVDINMEIIFVTSNTYVFPIGVFLLSPEVIDKKLNKILKNVTYRIYKLTKIELPAPISLMAIYIKSLSMLCYLSRLGSCKKYTQMIYYYLPIETAN